MTTTVLAVVVVSAHVLGLISALDAVMNTRTAQGAIAWAVGLISFPYVAVPAYWVLGRSKFQGFAEAREGHEDKIEALLKDVTPQIESTFVDVEHRVPEYEAVVSLAQMGITGNNRVELLIDGEATYASILEGIAGAKEYVLVEFYIVRDDGIGRRFRDALIERAQAGVRVYFVYDEIGTKLPASYGEVLRAAGVEFSPFNTTRGWRNRFQLNFRNHRKIVAVDGRTAWVGGLNVGDDYLGLYPKLTPWRDTHMRVQGPAVLQVQITFLTDWFWATRQLPSLRWQGVPAEDGSANVMVIPSSPATEVETATLFFLHALNSARERIWITSPYYVPDEGILNALRLAALRGVDVRVIIPLEADNPLVQAASLFYVEQLGDADIKFYQFNDGFLHQKVMLIDAHLATVGTANFDNRSFRLNFELTVLVRDEAFARDVERMLESDMQRSIPLEAATLQAQSWWQHVPRRVARLFAPVL